MMENNFFTEQVQTPLHIAVTMLQYAKEQFYKTHNETQLPFIINPFSKNGIFAKAAIIVFGESIKDNYYEICTSMMAKRVAEATFSFLGIDKSHILNDELNCSSYDLLKNKKNIINFFSDMKFDIAGGNPPYQGTNHQQIYGDFYLKTNKIADISCLIFPTGWRDNKNRNGLKLTNTKEVKEDKSIVFIDDRTNVFEGVSVGETVNIVLHDNNYDNGLDGKQKFLNDGVFSSTDFIFKDKESEIIELKKSIKISLNKDCMQNHTSITKPYGIRKNVLKLSDNELIEIGLNPFHTEKINDDDIKVIGSLGMTKFADNGYNFPRVSSGFNYYSVLVGSAWGNFDSKSRFLGGSYADIIIKMPHEVCTETYQESGVFNNIVTAKSHAKYLMSKFCRACLFIEKVSQMSSECWKSVPVQDYSEDFWESDDIDYIDECLFEKYELPDNVREFIRNNIQPKTVNNIVNYNNND